MDSSTLRSWGSVQSNSRFCVRQRQQHWQRGSQSAGQPLCGDCRQRADLHDPGAGVHAFHFANTAFTATSSFSDVLYTDPMIQPGSGSGSLAVIHLNPTINGPSTGIAYGLGIASKTNVLTGGTIKPFSVGTTTTNLFTGYTPLIEIDITGYIEGKEQIGR